MELGYDNTDMLTSASLKDAAAYTLLKSYGYEYDESGNRRKNTEDGGFLLTFRGII